MKNFSLMQSVLAATILVLGGCVPQGVVPAATVPVMQKDVPAISAPQDGKKAFDILPVEKPASAVPVSVLPTSLPVATLVNSTSLPLAPTLREEADAKARFEPSPTGGFKADLYYGGMVSGQHLCVGLGPVVTSDAAKRENMTQALSALSEKGFTTTSQEECNSADAKIGINMNPTYSYESSTYITGPGSTIWGYFGSPGNDKAVAAIRDGSVFNEALKFIATKPMGYRLDDNHYLSIYALRTGFESVTLDIFGEGSVSVNGKTLSSRSITLTQNSPRVEFSSTNGATVSLVNAVPDTKPYAKTSPLLVNEAIGHSLYEGRINTLRVVMVMDLSYISPPNSTQANRLLEDMGFHAIEKEEGKYDYYVRTGFPTYYSMEIDSLLSKESLPGYSFSANDRVHEYRVSGKPTDVASLFVKNFADLKDLISADNSISVDQAVTKHDDTTSVMYTFVSKGGKADVINLQLSAYAGGEDINKYSFSTQGVAGNWSLVLPLMVGNGGPDYRTRESQTMTITLPYDRSPRQVLAEVKNLSSDSPWAHLGLQKLDVDGMPFPIGLYNLGTSIN